MYNIRAFGAAHSGKPPAYRAAWSTRIRASGAVDVTKPLGCGIWRRRRSQFYWYLAR